jgi:hypothetical protein
MKLITVIQYLSLAYQTYHCSTILLCSPVSVSLCLHLLWIFDLLFFSTRAPQPSFSVLLSCSTHSLRFLCLLPFMIYVPFPLNAPFLFSVFQLLYTPECLSITATPISSLFCILIVSVHLVHPSPHTSACSHMSSTLPVHHGNSSASLAVRSICPSSLGVKPRFLSLSGS